MSRTTVVCMRLMGLTCVLLPSFAWAQQASGIAGLVEDTSGAVLPGKSVIDLELPG